MSVHLLNKSFFRLMLLLLAFQTVSCSTKKNTWTRRTYHNLTSHYNVYWNGNESMKTGLTDLRKTATDDYSKVLRVFNYGTKADASKINAPMERAIEKGAIGIQKHSMVFGGKEKVNWIDDSYLMMGKAHFYKKDFISAKRTFDFIATQFNYNPITYTAQMWLAATFQEMEQFEKAAPLFEALEAKRTMGQTPDEVNKNLLLFIADYNIVRGNYDKALSYLNESMPLVKSKHLKTRVMFITAQIHQIRGENMKAIALYRQVIKRNPGFDMDFEARINMARVFDGSQGDSKAIVKLLQKMLKDIKYEDYYDKVYYALAEIALRENNEPLEMKHLAKSVSSSTKNKQQKSTSALKLASIYFSKNEYVLSQAYYDTAVGSLPREYPGYDSIRLRASILSELVEDLTTIKRQDSLLKLANMDSTARMAVIDGIIKSLEEADRKREAEEREAERNVLMSNQFVDRTSNVSQSAEWYFYNPNTLSFGYTEFLRKWGRRKLEDNWRISDKQSISFESIESVALDGNAPGGGSSDSTAKFTDRDKGYYLRDIPLTDEAKTESLKQIEDAFNNLGYSYKEKLQDFPRSIDAYTQLNTRFPQSEYSLQSWYAQYKMHSQLGNTSEAEHFKQLILSNYPNTDYARVIEDPDYFVRKAAVADASLAFYEQTFDAYKNEEFFRVMLNTNKARNLYPEDVDLLPRFDFLRAIAKGRLETVDSMAVALEAIVKTYPTHPVASPAAAILRNMNKEFNMNIEVPDLPGDTASAEAESSVYVFAENEAHMVMIVAKSESVRIDPLKVRLSDFNNKDFKSAQLIIKSLLLDNDRSLVTIGNFSSSTAALDYANALQLSDYVFGGITRQDISVNPISMVNYPVFYRLKDEAEYEKFRKKHYITK